MIDRKKVEKALKLVEATQSVSGAKVTIDNDGNVSVLVYEPSDLDVVLERIPRLRRMKMSGGDVWAEGDYDGITVRVCNVGKCEVVYEEKEEPEMVPSGKTVTVKTARYVCPDEDIVAKEKS